MRDYKIVVEAVRRLLAEGTPGVLCTLVETEGSFYRKPGARMVVTGPGRIHGVISGGCLEHDLRDQALAALACGQVHLAHFDLTAGDEIYFGYGSGCPGKVWVLLEPLPPLLVDEDLQRLWLGKPLGGAQAVALVYETSVQGLPPGTRLVLSPEGVVTGGASAPAGLVDQLVRTSAQGISGPVTLEADGARIKVLLERPTPLPQLHLFGAGPDAEALHDLVVALGWDLMIHDDRPAYLRPERFPGATNLVLSTYDDDWSPPSGLGREAAVVVMTHNFLKDLTILRKILSLPVAYVGVLGARRRSLQLTGLLAQEGSLSERARKTAYGPIGLDLGGEDPWSIALAIVAEIQKVRTASSGVHLGPWTDQTHRATP